MQSKGLIVDMGVLPKNGKTLFSKAEVTFS